jgi:hypothetical protein
MPRLETSEIHEGSQGQGERSYQIARKSSGTKVCKWYEPGESARPVGLFKLKAKTRAKWEEGSSGKTWAQK